MITKVLITHTTKENFKKGFFSLLDEAENKNIIFLYLDLTFEEFKDYNYNIDFKGYAQLKKKYKSFFLKFYSNENTQKLDKLFNILNYYLENFKPDIVCVFGTGIFHRLLTDLCYMRKIKVFFSENTPIPGTFYINKKQQLFFTLFKNLKNLNKNKNSYKFKIIGKKIIDKARNDMPSRHDINSKFPKEYQMRFNKKKLLILGTDLVSNSLYPDFGIKKTVLPLFNSVGDMINFITENFDCDVWFNTHPSSLLNNKYYSNIKKRKNLKMGDGSKISSVELIKKADIIISTGLSKLELNAVSLNKPLIYFSNGWFCNQGYSEDCKSIKQFVNSINKYLKKNIRPNNELIYSILGWYETTNINLENYINNKNLSKHPETINKFINSMNIKNEINKKNLNGKIFRDMYLNNIKKYKLIENYKNQSIITKLKDILKILIRYKK